MLAKFRLFAAVALCVGAVTFSQAQQSLNNKSVMDLQKAGLSEDLIVTTITNSPGKYDTSADSIIAMKKAGITDKEIGAILVKNASATNAAASTGKPDDSGGTELASGAIDRIIPKGATVFVTPMNGFETYLISALDKKQVPVIVVTDESKAAFIVTGNADSQKAGWAKTVMSGSSRSTEEASINVTNKKSGAIVFAYNVNKSNSYHGKQSSAEACAKHLKERIESGK